MIKTSNFTTKQGTRKALYKNVMVEYKRVYPVNFSFRHSGKAYRNYEKFPGEKPYYLLQSYNIETDLENLINNILEKYDLSLPEFDKKLVKNWYDVITLNDQN